MVFGKKRGNRKLAGRVGEGKNALCIDRQGTRGWSDESGGAAAQGFERRTGRGRHLENRPKPQLFPTATPFSQKEYCLPTGSRAVFSKQSPINRL